MSSTCQRPYLKRIQKSAKKFVVKQTLQEECAQKPCYFIVYSVLINVRLKWMILKVLIFFLKQGEACMMYLQYPLTILFCRFSRKWQEVFCYYVLYTVFTFSM